MSLVSLDARASTTHRERQPPAGPRDWSGLWFRIVEEDCGEYVGMRGGKLRPDGSIAWRFLSHAEYDGLGGFVHLLRLDQPGAQIDVPVRKSRKPSLMERASALLALIARKPRPAAAWKGMHSAQPRRRTHAGAALATVLLDKDRTGRLEVKAKTLGVPLNSLLLSALGRASQSELEGGPALWMMPVNMRGPVALAIDTANQTGYLQIEIASNASPCQAHEQVKEALRRRDHWATWLFLNAGRVVGYAGMRQIYKLQMARFGGRPFVGSFTNLGKWDGHGHWFVCPPVARTCPVGVGVIICNGQLSLTIEAHPTMAESALLTRTILRRMLAQLEA